MLRYLLTYLNMGDTADTIVLAFGLVDSDIFGRKCVNLGIRDTDCHNVIELNLFFMQSNMICDQQHSIRI